MEIEIYSRLVMWLFTIYYIIDGFYNVINENINQSKIYGCMNCKAEYMSEVKFCADCDSKLGKYYD
jgi:hypothetical protein